MNDYMIFICCLIGGFSFLLGWYFGTIEGKAQVREKLRFLRFWMGKIEVGGCTCNTKTHELQYHSGRCHYLLASFADNALKEAGVRFAIPEKEDVSFKYVEERTVGMNAAHGVFYGLRTANKQGTETGRFSTINPNRSASAPVCGNCDTALPLGCQGLFKNDGELCALNKKDTT